MNTRTRFRGSCGTSRPSTIISACSPNSWSHDTTFGNIIQKLIPLADVSGTQWDPNSIMHYAFAAGLIDQPVQYRTGLTPAGGLSQHDQAQVKLFYPPLHDAANAELKPLQSGGP